MIDDVQNENFTIYYIFDFKTTVKNKLYYYNN